MNDFSDAQKTVLSLLGQNLFSVPFSPDPNTDWSEVLRESKLQALSLIVFKEYKQLPLNSEMVQEIQKMIKACTVTNIRCFRNHAYLHALMTKANIPYCIMKGVVSAHYYPEPFLRNMGDVDFYVQPADIDRGVELFINEGFERMDEHVHHVGLIKKNIHCEMHFDLMGMPCGEVGEIIGEYRESLLAESRVMIDELTEYRGPSAFHHGLIMLLHLQNHLLVEGIGLRHLCDWAVFANSFSEEEFVAMFEERLKRVGLWRFACLLGLAASEYMGMPYKSWMGNDLSTATELITDILSGGNFGRKDKQRRYEAMFISVRGKSGVETNRVRQAMRSLNDIVRNHWKVVEKCPLLYPVGWVFFSVRYLVRLLFGKRKLNIPDTYKQSGIRKNFYKKLNLFEPEK